MPGILTPGRTRTVLVVVCLALFVDTLLYSVAVPVLPGYSQRFGASSTAVGLLFAAYAIGLLLASPAAGAVSDRVGRRVPMVVGSFGIALATMIFTVANSYEVLLAARFVQGISAAVVWTAGVALIADVFPPAGHGAAMGAVMASTSLGLIAGAPFGGLLTQGFGPRAPFMAAAAVAAVNGAIQLWAVPARSWHRPRPSDLRRLLAQPPAFAAAAAVAMGAGALSFLEPTLPLDLSRRLGAGVAAIGIAFGVATLVHVATAVGAGYLTGRLPYGVFAGGGLVVMGGLTPVLVVVRPLTAVVAVLAAFAIALTFVLVPALPEMAALVDRFGAGYGGAYALFNVAYAVGMLVGPLAGGAGFGVAPARLVYACAGVAVAIGGFLLLAVEAAAPSRASARNPTTLEPTIQQPDNPNNPTTQTSQQPRQANNR